MGYFDPRLDQSHGPSNVVLVGQDIYYRDVFLFLKQAKAIFTLKGPIVRECLF